MGADRHRRQRALPRLPRHLGRSSRARRCSTRRSCSTTPATRARAPSRRARVAKPSVTVAVKPSSTGGPTEIKATTTPERSHYAVTVQRRIGDGAWTYVGTDDSSPAYIVYDAPPAVPTGTPVAYRAILDYGSGTATSPEPRPFTTAIVHYRRSAADYADWGLHLWGDAIAPGVETGWGAPREPDETDAYGVLWRIPVQDESKPVNFIVHQPLGDSVPTTREPGGDRSFTPPRTPRSGSTRTTRRSTRARRGSRTPRV